MLAARKALWRHSSPEAISYSFFQARNAIYHSLKLLHIEPGSHVLVPSYICRAAIDPLIAYGADVEFYAVKRDCSIDLPDLERRITPLTRALVIVHYFGFPQPLAHLRRLCDERRLALIEDCAHVLSGETEGIAMGTVGDAAVFSWRKFLPIYDGAELMINRPKSNAKIDCTKESSLFTLRVAANMLDASLGRTSNPLLKAVYGGIRLGETTFRKLTHRRLRNAPMLQAEANAIFFDLESVNWPMCRLSRWTMRHSNVPKIVTIRRRNYNMLLDELSSSKHIRPLFPDLPLSVCPWVCPVVFTDSDSAHTFLRGEGIPAATWGGVRHPLVTRGRFTDSDFLYDNLVFLPVHQCLQRQDILRIARTARTFRADERKIDAIEAGATLDVHQDAPAVEIGPRRRQHKLMPT